jgi:hypothetical protein
MDLLFSSAKYGTLYIGFSFHIKGLNSYRISFNAMSIKDFAAFVSNVPAKGAHYLADTAFSHP